MPGFVTVRFRDAGQEYSTMRIPVEAAVGATTWTELLSYLTTAETVLGNVSIGNIISIGYSQEGVSNADAPASNPFAQRELGLRVFIVDDVTGDKSYMTVPCPDLANIALETDGDHADLTDTEVAALVTWIEANVQINDGNAVSVDRAIVVGRSS